MFDESAHLKTTVSAQTARSGWVALRSLGGFLADRRIAHENGQSVLRSVRQPKVKDDTRQPLSDGDMWRLMEQSQNGEMGHRDHAIVMTLLGCGLRREELSLLNLSDFYMNERRLHVSAETSKSNFSRDVTVPVETIKALDVYVHDYRVGEGGDNAPLFADRHGRRLTGNGIRKLFERLRVKIGIRNLSAHVLRHTWATNFHRSASGSRFDLMTEGGWTTGRMVERYTKARPFLERRRAPSVFTAAKTARSEKRPSEMRPSQQRSGPAFRGAA